MARIGLTHGVGTNVGSLVLAGAGAVTGASSDQLWLQIVGWTGMVFGLLLLAWGVTWDGEQWWKRWCPKLPPKSPVRVADKLYIDCDPVGHKLGEPVLHLYSAAYCIEVENVAPDKTVRGLRAVYRDLWGEDWPLPIRGTDQGQIDLHPKDKARIEIGRMIMQMEPGHVPGVERDKGYWVVGEGDLDHAYNLEKNCEYFQVSAPDADRMVHWKEKVMYPIKIIITAADTAATEVEIKGDLWANKARDRLVIVPQVRQ